MQTEHVILAFDSFLWAPFCDVVQWDPLYYLFDLAYQAGVFLTGLSIWAPSISQLICSWAFLLSLPLFYSQPLLPAPLRRMWLVGGSTANVARGTPRFVLQAYWILLCSLCCSSLSSSVLLRPSSWGRPSPTSPSQAPPPFLGVGLLVKRRFFCDGGSGLVS